MNKLKKVAIPLIVLITTFYSCSNKSVEQIDLNRISPWCIVAFDSLKRSPEERIAMLKEMDFTKYAYDWRDKDLDEMEREIKLARENDIEIISVWLWLNAKRDSLGGLSSSNERLFEILLESKLKTKIWVSFSENYFKNRTHEQSLSISTKMIQSICDKAKNIGCELELYNHGGWFGEVSNQVEIIKELPQCNLKIVYNFHHGHKDIDKFSQIIDIMKPYLSSVNLNGMRKNGSKILTI